MPRSFARMMQSFRHLGANKKDIIRVGKWANLQDVKIHRQRFAVKCSIRFARRQFLSLIVGAIRVLFHKFDWENHWVVIAADAAMTPDFWAERRGYFNSVDFDAAARSIETLAGMADLIVPGHDNYFLVRS